MLLDILMVPLGATSGVPQSLTQPRKQLQCQSLLFVGVFPLYPHHLRAWLSASVRQSSTVRAAILPFAPMCFLSSSKA